MKRVALRVAICSIIGAAIVGGPVWLRPRRYVASALFRFNPPQLQFDVNTQWERVQESAFGDNYLRGLADRHHLYWNRPLPERLTRIRYDMVTEFRWGPRAKTMKLPVCCYFVGFAGEDSQATYRVARDVVRQFDTTSRGSYGSPPCPEPGDCGTPGFEMLDSADIRGRPTPDLLAFTALGAALGLIAAVVHELGRDRRIPDAHHS